MALQWDEMVAGYRRQLWLERAALRTLLDLLDVATGELLLDVATGPAPLLSELSNRERRPATAVGVDTSAAMIALAPPLPSAWRLQVADATDMPFDEGSFDVATASYLLHVLDRDARRAAIAECARVLAPGGRLGTITIAPPRRSIATAITAPIRAAAQRSQGRLAGLRPLDPTPELEAAGFGVVARRRSFRGYPSLCLVARRQAGPSG